MTTPLLVRALRRWYRPLAWTLPWAAWRRPLFAHLGAKVRFGRHLELRGTDAMWLGARVLVQRGATLLAERAPDGGPSLMLRDRVVIGRHALLAARQRIELGEYTGIGSGVLIADFDHGHEHPWPPYVYGAFLAPRPVVVGRNCWIGQGAVLLPGVTVGDGAIIGAYALVNRDVPAYCVAVGQPARVVKAYDFARRCWASADGRDLPPPPAWEEMAALFADRASAAPPTPADPLR